MCGIIGYIGNKNLASVLITGLERLSYRGYDSSGIAVICEGEINTWKKAGKLKELKDTIQGLTIHGEAGIGHTRWATHGVPNDTNSHPHLSDNKVAIVHNGIIENFEEIRKELLKKKYVLSSDTDSEIIAHLLNEQLTLTNGSNDLNLARAGVTLLEKLEGSMAVAAITEYSREKILCIRKNMPLIIGIEKEEKYICSDIQTLMFYTHNYIEIEDDEVAIVTREQVEVYDRNLNRIEKTVQQVDWEVSSEGKGKYPHYMLKEIYEQPDVLRTILNEYLTPPAATDTDAVAPIDFFSATKQSSDVIDLAQVERFIIQACGTSWHAGLIAKYWIENYARVLVEVDVSSELRYRNVLSRPNDVVLAVSQSGETADTLACIRESKSQFLKVVSFVNVRGSSMDREANLSIYSLAGREVGVASTKNYLSQLVNLYLFALHMGYLKNNLTSTYIREQLDALKHLPHHIEKLLKQSDEIRTLAKKFLHQKGFLFIGRGVSYPTALEGALKLKELAYVYAAGYAAGELKHGPLSLVDENMPVFCVIPNSGIYQKVLSNLQEVKARKGIVIAVASESNTEISQYADYVFPIPDVHEHLSPILSVIPLQLFAYHLANELGCDVDQPKNLAKSVTVE